MRPRSPAPLHVMRPSIAQMVRVLLFDEAKGLEEGSELSALLGYFPATAPDDARVTTLGFARTGKMVALMLASIL